MTPRAIHARGHMVLFHAQGQRMNERLKLLIREGGRTRKRSQYDAERKKVPQPKEPVVQASALEIGKVVRIRGNSLRVTEPTIIGFKLAVRFATEPPAGWDIDGEGSRTPIKVEVALSELFAEGLFRQPSLVICAADRRESTS